MRLFDNFLNRFSVNDDTSTTATTCNPCNGLPLVAEDAAIDIKGNLIGTCSDDYDLLQTDTFESTSSIDDSLYDSFSDDFTTDDGMTNFDDGSDW